MRKIVPVIITNYSRTSMAGTGWGHRKFETKIVPAIQVSFYINMNPRDPSPIYETSAVRVFVLLFSFSIFSDRRSLKIKKENNTKT